VKVVVQRVSQAEVRVDGAVVGRIAHGMLLFVGVLAGDGEAACDRLAERVAGFRFFPDEAGRMNRAAAEVGAAALVVSQFTLAADGRRGRRPSFDRAAPPALAEPLVERFAARLGALGLAVERGVFGARMDVSSVNDGPVTFVLEEPPPPAVR
jgi:D-tyrosyl-tRNA(Tyr) deacylase